MKNGMYEEKEIPYDIYKNPTPEELDQSLSRCRNFNRFPGVHETDEIAGILTDKDEVFIAPRAVADHWKLENDLKIEIEIAFYVDQSKNLKISRWSSPSADQDELASHPQIQAMMGQRTEHPRLAS